MSEIGKSNEDLKIKDWSKRIYNQPFKHKTINK